MKPYLADQLKQSRAQGFTLLEVLIAITITALIGIGSSQLLSTAIQANEQTQAKLKEFRDLQMAVLFIGRDIQQIVPRAIRDEFGDHKGAVSTEDNTYTFQFSRTGWRNPMEDTRSDIQRVAYELRDGQLYRHYWPVLDRAQDSQTRERQLLDNIEEFTVQFRTEKGAWVDEWPPELTSPTNLPIFEKLQLPKALRIKLLSPKFGEITRLYDLPVALDSTVIASSNGSNSGNNSGNEEDTGGSGSNGDSDSGGSDDSGEESGE